MVDTLTPLGWDAVVGQDTAVARLHAAVEQPVHAYLFVGPRGAGKRAALRAFAADLLAAEVADAADAARVRALAWGERHPDLVVIEPEGAQFRGGKVDGDDSEGARAIREAWSSPVEAGRKVVALVDFHLANDAAVGSLLKTIEEPPPRTVLVLLAEHLPPGHAAVASRCMIVEFGPVAEAVLVDALVAEGVEPAHAADVVALAGGDLERARVLATDARLHSRVEAWRAVPSRLDGTGARAAAQADDLRAMIDDAAAPLASLQAEELTRFDEEAERYGLRGVAGRRRALVASHNRVVRRFRTDELRLGLANLAAIYRDEAAGAARPEPAFAALAAIQAAAEVLAVNPNEELWLQALFVGLPRLSSQA